MGLEDPAEPRVRFGAYEFDVQTLELQRGGKPVRIQRQPARVLSYLICRSGRLVSREDLIQHVWGGTFVDANQGLNNSIRHLRSVLGDNADSPVYIETAPRLGYRFIAPLSHLTSEAPLSREPSSRTLSRILRWALVPVVAAGIPFGWWIQSRNPTSLDLNSSNSGTNRTQPTADSRRGQSPEVSGRGQYFEDALQLLSSRDPSDWRSSIAFFEEVVRKNPQDGRALLGRATASWRAAGESDAQRQAAQKRTDETLSHTPNSPDAHLLRAEIAFLHQWDVPLAEAHYARALDLGSGLKEVHSSYGLFCAVLRRDEIARRHAEIAMDLDPSAASTVLKAGIIHLRTRNFVRSLDLCRRAQESDVASTQAVECQIEAHTAAGSVPGRETMARWLSSLDPPQQVIDRINTVPNPNGNNTVPNSEAALNRFLRWRLHVLFVAARESIGAGLAGAGSDESLRPIWLSSFGELASPGRLAAAAAHLGNEKLALEWLRMAHTRRSPSFLRWATSPAFNGLSEHPDYLRLLKDSPFSNEDR